MTAGAGLTARTLHASLQDPKLASMGFLNEVMTRYPNAISFAPGAPNLGHLLDTDVTRYVDRFVDHLCAERGLDRRTARRKLYEYGPARGLINDLVAAAVGADQGVDVPGDAVVVTVGAQEAMFVTLRALFREPGDVLAVVEPCFVGILGAARLLDIDVVAVPETDRGPDVGALARVCASEAAAGRRVRAVYVAPDHANPSGTVTDLVTRQRLLRLAEQAELIVLEDNTYGFTADESSALPALKAMPGGERVVLIGTFAKICLPGARVGYAIADQPVRGSGGRLLADELATVKSMVTVNTAPLCQAVIGGMLLEHGGSIARLGRDRAAVYRRNLGVLLAALDRRLGSGVPGVRWNRPTGGFFVRMRIPARADHALLELSASRYGVLWTPMSDFYLTGAGDDELRLSCSYLEPESIDIGVERLGLFLRDMYSSGIDLENMPLIGSNSRIRDPGQSVSGSNI